MIRRPTVLRFLRYSLVGGSTLLFDLILLYLITTYGGVPYYIGTPLAFLVAVSVNYFISRRFVFGGTTRGHGLGYSYFITAALVGAGVTTLGVALLVTYAGLYFMFARVLTAGVVGIGNYLFNLFYNFKVVGLHE